MAHVRIPRSWDLPESSALPEAEYFSRRAFLGRAGAGGLAILATGCARGSEPATGPATAGLYPARRNPAFALDRDLTDEQVAGATINYYEFSTDKQAVASLARGFRTHPWSVEVAGLVAKPRHWDIDDLVRGFPLEERLYRHRCVERWAMAVPWTGFPLARFLTAHQPLSTARFVRFVSFLRPEEAPGQKEQTWYPWPYFEGLTMAEAMHDLTLLATGIYGKPMPPHHGAPLRLVVPWKYGYKSIKGIVRVELTAERPPTFWNAMAPMEYGFISNVDPVVSHPRWSQATETLIGTDRVVPTLPYNGYGDLVAHLYA